MSGAKRYQPTRTSLLETPGTQIIMTIKTNLQISISISPRFGPGKLSVGTKN